MKLPRNLNKNGENSLMFERHISAFFAATNNTFIRDHFELLVDPPGLNRKMEEAHEGNYT